MSEIQFSIQQEFREKQEKYIYYLIALSVSAIGFSIYKTENKTLTYSQIPLAVIFWSISIFCGLKFLKYIISNLYANNDYYEIIKGRHPNTGKNPELMQIGVEAFQEAMKINSKSMKRYFKFQGYLFYSGIILFILWHITEMYLKTEMLNVSCH